MEPGNTRPYVYQSKKGEHTYGFPRFLHGFLVSFINPGYLAPKKATAISVQLSRGG